MPRQKCQLPTSCLDWTFPLLTAYPATLPGKSRSLPVRRRPAMGWETRPTTRSVAVDMSPPVLAVPDDRPALRRRSLSTHSSFPSRRVSGDHLPGRRNAEPYEESVTWQSGDLGLSSDVCLKPVHD
ncbi:hypothetical protein BP00DRAFT_64676 [Aspergillus indologenus CBS 114.80]|uniref:Uncharacterized protein n=1 Tax=Aspergillus indologenus CBS 114.80 TaxID=1450541 RepID=A0A2V5ICG5_9EURO|nr:hypothetical protein BP00DRAFT_64676 [Aspergillus indologenus CBS 114.80]